MWTVQDPPPPLCTHPSRHTQNREYFNGASQMSHENDSQTLIDCNVQVFFLPQKLAC